MRTGITCRGSRPGQADGFVPVVGNQDFGVEVTPPGVDLDAHVRCGFVPKYNHSGGLFQLQRSGLWAKPFFAGANRTGHPRIPRPPAVPTCQGHLTLSKMNGPAMSTNNPVRCKSPLGPGGSDPSAGMVSSELSVKL